MQKIHRHSYIFYADYYYIMQMHFESSLQHQNVLAYSDQLEEWCTFIRSNPVCLATGLLHEWMNEQAVCLGPWGKGVCERPSQQPCPAYSFSWRPSLMPVSHAAGDEHFTATVQFLRLGTLTFPASSKRILFSGLCWDGRVLEIGYA